MRAVPDHDATPGSTVFSRIITGELPGRLVYEDDAVVAFLSIAPIRPGHTLVVPRLEVDDWTGADPGLLAHCMEVAQRIGQAVKAAWHAPRAVVMIAGFEVPHLHVHVFPAWGLSDVDAARADAAASVEDLDAAQRRIREQLADIHR
jgi:diadenosine tetraphosphate (Ap4A) HIT family hydrolase